MKHLFVMLAFILMTSLAFVSVPSMAWAENPQNPTPPTQPTQPSGNVKFFDAAQQKSADVFKNTKTIIYIVGAFGLMVLAVGAIFGKLAWRTLAYLAIGLLLLVGAGGIVDYFVGKSSLETTLGDSLWTSSATNNNQN